MTLLKKLVQGDVGDTCDVQLGGIVDLNVAISHVEAHVWKGSTRVTIGATLLDPNASSVRIACGPTAGTGWLPTKPTPGKWYTEVQILFASGDLFTWPAPAESDDKLRTTSDAWFLVRAQGEP